jgi:metallo-beta-lactamase family protein
VHEADDSGDRLSEIIRAAADRGGKVIVPSFAIGRVEEVIYWLKRLEAETRIPILPVYLDSPMASEALQRYRERIHELDEELQPQNTDDVAPHDQAAHESDAARQMHARQERDMCAFCTERFHIIRSVEESKQLTASRVPAIVISSSGMAEGGRVLHHLKATLPNARNTVVFTGYQGLGTRGRRLVDGEKQIKIHGEWVPVAARIELLGSMSAHADSNEIMRWLHGFSRAPQQTFIVHGEYPSAMEALGARIDRELGWTHVMPEHGQTVQF